MKLEKLLSESKNFVRENKGFCIGAGLLIGAQIADSYMTFSHMTNIDDEANPFMRTVLEQYGKSGFLAVKALSVPYFLHAAHKKRDNLYLWTPAAIYSLAASAWLLK